MKNRLLRGLGPNVVALGLASFFTDVGSEMVYPLMQELVTGTLKASAAWLGVVEGASNAVSSLVRIFSGWLSDRMEKRKPFIVLGYGISSVTRPFYALVAAPWHVLLIRVSDRFGKGTRLAPRDALLADSCDPDVRGKAFGMQHAMDQLGASLGPLVCVGLLALGWELRKIFFVTAIPAAFLIVVLFALVRDIPPKGPPAARPRLSLAPFDGNFRWFLAVATVFTLGVSTDLFLLQRGAQLGLSLKQRILVYMGLNLVRTVAGIPGGVAADLLGRRAAILAGWAIYVAAYVGLAATHTLAPYLAFVGLFGLYASLGDSNLRAVVTDLVPKDLKGTAFGIFHFCVGVASLPGGATIGWIFDRKGAPAAFLFSAGVAVVAGVMLFRLRIPRNASKT